MGLGISAEVCICEQRLDEPAHTEGEYTTPVVNVDATALRNLVSEAALYDDVSGESMCHFGNLEEGDEACRGLRTMKIPARAKQSADLLERPVEQASSSFSIPVGVVAPFHLMSLAEVTPLQQMPAEAHNGACGCSSVDNLHSTKIRSSSSAPPAEAAKQVVIDIEAWTSETSTEGPALTLPASTACGPPVAQQTDDRLKDAHMPLTGKQVSTSHSHKEILSPRMEANLQELFQLQKFKFADLLEKDDLIKLPYTAFRNHIVNTLQDLDSDRAQQEVILEQQVHIAKSVRDISNVCQALEVQRVSFASGSDVHFHCDALGVLSMSSAAMSHTGRHDADASGGSGPVEDQQLRSETTWKEMEPMEPTCEKPALAAAEGESDADNMCRARSDADNRNELTPASGAASCEEEEEEELTSASDGASCEDPSTPRGGIKSWIKNRMSNLGEKLPLWKQSEAHNCFFFHTDGSFMSEPARDGQTWAVYCSPVDPSFTNNKTLVGRWAECLRAAVLSENAMPKCEDDAVETGMSPTEQVLQYFEACGHSEHVEALQTAIEAYRKTLHGTVTVQV